MDFLLNEKSLYGQFENTETFIKSLAANVNCFRLIKKCGKHQIWKVADFYKCRITADRTIGDLKIYPRSEELKRFQIALDKEIKTAPFWDEEPVHNIGGCYLLDGEDVTATAVAEATERKAGLLSFKSEQYADRELEVYKSDGTCHVISVYTPGYLAEKFRQDLELDRDTYLKIRYAGTRMDCSLIEDVYGADTLEEEEYLQLIGTLDKFAAHESWETIERDDGLEYKKYKPAAKEEDWFRNSPYRNETIMKFRFSQKFRAYGYRKGERFRLLRLERDHKKSDKG